ncbi:hypothetical protein D6C97_03930 [Aureobasidium pullulans]|nr:hypothetical protein D6C97_03930 [Aureobasidium pullulans]
MATTIKTSSFLIELPQELKDMIYDYVFSVDYAKLLGDSATSHPLMRTSKQLRAEARVPFIRALARSSILYIGCDLKKPTNIGCYFTWKTPSADGINRQPREAHLCSRWSVFRHSNFAHEFVPRLQQIFLALKPVGSILLSIDFECDPPLHIAADWLCCRGRHFESRADRIFRAGIKTWEDQFTACSIAWIEDLLLAIRDTWIEARSRSYMDDSRRHDLTMQGHHYFP